MGPVERRQWAILLAIVCLLVGWNYWLDKFLFSSPFAVFGSGFGDFELYRLAAASWLAHEPTHRFIYPPTSLPFFAVYASIPFHLAGQLWWITYFAFFVAACVSLWLALKDADRRLLFITIAVLLFFTSYPLLVLFQLGQIDLLTEALAIMSLTFLRSRHGFASAVMLSLSVLLKGPAVLLLVYFVLFRRDLSYLLHFFLSVLVIVGASLAIVPVGYYWHYLSYIVPRLRYALNSNTNQSIGGIAALAHLNYVGPAVSLAVFALFALFSFWAGSRRLPFNHESLSSDAMFLMNVLMMLLLNPRSIIYPYVWVILPLALFLSAILMEPVKGRYLALVGFGAFLLNSNVVPSILNYQILPLEIVGNIVTSLCLVLLYVRPTIIIELKAGRH